VAVEDDGADPTAVKILLLLLSRDGRTVRDRQRRRPRREVDRRPAALQRAGRRPDPRQADARTNRRGWTDPRRADRGRAGGDGRRRWIHDGQGLLLPSRERIDDGGRQMALAGKKKGKLLSAAAVTQ